MMSKAIFLSKQSGALRGAVSHLKFPEYVNDC